MELSVIILNYNASVFLELCVESVLRATKNLKAEIIVADNDSTDDSINRLVSRYDNVKIIRLDDNYGFSKGNNIAVEQARGEFICLVNPDVIVSEKVFEKSIDFFRSIEESHTERSLDNTTNLEPGFLGIKLIDGTGTFLPESKRRIPTPLNALNKLLGFSSSYYDKRLEENEDGATDVLVGAFIMGRKSVYQELGGLDERYFMYGEDIDLSYTALKNGYKNYYLGSQQAIHFKGESTVKDQLYQERFYGAISLFYEKHYPTGKLLSRLFKGILPKLSRKQEASDLSPSDRESIICVTNDPTFNPAWASRSISWEELDRLEELKATLVFDSKSLSFEDSMQFMNKRSELKSSFRFLTLDRSAYAGSDSSYHRGDVIRF
jgi:GT2 family glycosyltransferase